MKASTKNFFLNTMSHVYKILASSSTKAPEEIGLVTLKLKTGEELQNLRLLGYSVLNRDGKGKRSRSPKATFENLIHALADSLVGVALSYQENGVAKFHAIENGHLLFEIQRNGCFVFYDILFFESKQILLIYHACQRIAELSRASKNEQADAPLANEQDNN